MDISVVICTKDRASALRECLCAIFALEFEGAWEIIVIDNNSTDDTPRQITQMKKLSPVPFRSMVETSAGNSAGRNAGIRHAQGKVVFFTDDDCLVAPNLLKELWHVFKDNRVGYAGGQIRLFNPDDFPISIMQVSTPIAIRPGSIVYPGLVQGSNMAFRRDVLIELGGFDPLFGAGSKFAGEDLELATRASLNGWHGGYFPTPVVHHNHGRDYVKAMASQRQYDFGIGAYYAKFLFNAPTRWKCVLLWLRRSIKQIFYHPSGLPRQLAGAISYAKVRGAHV